MFVRQRKNQSGSVSVQVIEKQGRKNVVVTTIGCSSLPHMIEHLVDEAHLFIARSQKQMSLDFEDAKRRMAEIMLSISDIRSTGLEELLGRIYRDIGFDELGEETFKWLVLARIVKPVSKLATTDYLRRHHNYDVDVQVLYRFLDKLDDRLKHHVHDIAFAHTREVLGGEVNVVFYDVTTLYFETQRQDELRIPGFSKDGKSQNPQILLGLLVGPHGYPIAYDIFEGNRFEGHTMLPIVEALVERYRLPQPVIVADAGLMNNSNIAQLDHQGFGFILGARIKNTSRGLMSAILALKLTDGQSATITTPQGHRLIVHYSAKRAAKDAFDREKGIERARKLVEKQNLTKDKLTNHGYKKFLKIRGKAKLGLDTDKIKEAAQWDGLKGYLTNTELGAEEVMSRYRDLWEVERSFRITKHDLEARPMYHRIEPRIRAHLCICFAALKVKKELERQLKAKGAPFSTNEAIALAERIFTLKNTVPGTREIVEVMRFENADQRLLAKLFDFEIPDGNHLAFNLGV